jgi:hypothetical protein
VKNLKNESTALVKMVMANFKEFTIYRCNRESAPIFAYKKTHLDTHFTFLYFKQTLQLVNDHINITDIVTGEILGSANKHFNFVYLGAAIELKF